MGGLATAIALKVGASAATAGTVGSVATTSLIAGGTALDVIGTLRAGKAEKEQAGVEEALSEQQALEEDRRTIEEERLRRKAGEKLKARQVAQFAKGGVRVGEGSPLLVAAETAFDTTEDINAIRAGGSARSRSFRSRAQTFRSVGKARKTTSRFKAGSSLISGIDDLTRSNP